MKMRNDEVLINFQVPEIIQRIIDEIDVYVEKGANCRGNLSDMDDCEYDVLLQKLDVISKRYVSGGRLSAAQRDLLPDRYCAW